MNTLQEIVDLLALELERPVGLDDRRFRAIAYSSHDVSIDEVRRDSILGRRAPSPVTDWLVDLGVGDARGPLRIPANPEFGMEARVCVPLWAADRLHAYLWLIDEPDDPVDDEDLAVVARHMHDLVVELDREHTTRSVARLQEAEEVARILDGGTPEPGAFHRAPLYAAIVLRLAEATADLPRADEIVLAGAVAQLRRTLGPQRLLARIEEERAVVLLACDTSDEPLRRAETITTVADEAARASGTASLLVGLGDPATSVTALPEAHAEADLAARLATLPGQSSPVAYADLGGLALVAELVDGRDPLALLPPGLDALLADRDAVLLCETVEAYLDSAGDAARTAAGLYIHRSSLYKRLRRVEQISGLDLRSGSDRLSLQIGLHLWRLGGSPVEPSM